MIYCPSVTEVLSILDTYSGVNPATLDAAAERGTAVHKACAAVAKGLPVVGLRDDLQGYLKSFRKWFDLLVDKVLLVETRLVDEAYLFHGHPDLIVVLRSRNADITTVDLKTPVQHYKTWALQMAAYNRLAVVNWRMVTYSAGTLQLDADGGVPKMIWYEQGRRDFNLFLNCLNLYRYMKG